ncbi:MAG: hypothetical protein JSW50_06365 [Candidatus Latescibacterota bacterium]|nr:MAG: hypothetical protein JSW50_06365 [Candidatus Latescibacterota bacterium]
MFRTTHLAVLFMGIAVLLGAACSNPATAPENVPVKTAPTGCKDGDCPIGQECDGVACVPVRPTLYPHIQLASALLREYQDYMEMLWRAGHADLLIGRVGEYADQLRAENPNVRLFEYATFRYSVYPEIEDWAQQNGKSYEDMFLHYREDVQVPGFETVVLVPGMPPGFAPGWNPERTSNDPPASATERSQSRAPGILQLGAPWYLMNIVNPDYREFLIDLMERALNGDRFGGPFISGDLDGIMVDHGVYYPMWNEGLLDKTNEFYQLPVDDTHPYPIGFEMFYTELREALTYRLGHDVDLLPNYGHIAGLSRDDRFSQNIADATDWAWGEVWVTFYGHSFPTSGTYRAITYDKDYVKGIANVVRQTLAGGRRVLGARDNMLRPNGSDRGRLYTLALYYLVHNPNTFYNYLSSGSHMYSGRLEDWQWNPAVEYDIGQPEPVPDGIVDFDGNSGTREHYVFATGPDPYDTSLTYRVLARRFSKALVLAKMLPLGSVVDDQSITTHPLDRAYAILRPDGTVGEDLVTEVSIRNNEGVILVIP